MILTRPAMSGVIGPASGIEALGLVRPPRSWSADIKPPLGTVINWNHPLASGLINCFLVSEGGGTLVRDLANASYVATLTGIILPTWTTDQATVCLNTTGSLTPDLQVPVPDTNYLGNLSILWTGTPRIAGAFHVLVHKTAGTGATNNPFEFRTNATTPLQLQILASDATNLNSWTSFGTFPAGVHHQLGVARPAALNTNVTFWINGVRSEGSLTGGAAVTATGTNEPIHFFARGGGPQFDGKFTSCYIWNRLLAPQEFQSLYVNPYQFFMPIRFH